MNFEDDEIDFAESLRMCGGADCRHPRANGDYVTHHDPLNATNITYCLRCFCSDVIGIDPDEIPRDM